MSESKGDVRESSEIKYENLQGDEPDGKKKYYGPVKSRSCTDIICLFIFLIFIIALLAVSFWAFIFGDVRKLIHPTNSNGEICGVSPGVIDKPKLVFFNLFTCVKMGPALFAFGCPTKQVCVKKCPKMFWSDTINTGNWNMVCEGDKKGNDSYFDGKSVQYLVSNKICAKYVFPSLSVSGRCIPDITKVVDFLKGYDKTQKSSNNDSEIIINNAKEYNKLFGVAETASKVILDINKCYIHIIVGFVLALTMSLLYLILLRFFATFMVWMTLILFVLTFVAGTAISFFTYYLIRADAAMKEKFSWYIFTKYDNLTFWLTTGIVLSIVLVLLLLIIIFLRNRIKIAIAIINSTSKSLVYMMGLLVWPIILFLFQIVVIVGCLLLLLQLSTVRRPEGVIGDIGNLTDLNVSDIKKNLTNLLEKFPCEPGQNTTAQKVCTFIKYGTKTYVYVFMAYTLFMFFWLTNFFKALGQITIAGAFASYYFAYDKPKDIPTFPVITSFWRAIRYHTGSLAFGSLILAIVQFIRAILNYLNEKAKTGQNILAELFVKCLICCFWCLEKFIKFLDKNAYIMIAIYGDNFCASARNAFSLILRNLIRVVVLDKITDIILFLGKLVIVGSIGTLSFLFFNGTLMSAYLPKLFYFYIPIIILIIGTYIIASMFFQVYEMGTDTIFLCFCEDLEINDGSKGKPYYMSKELMSILGKKNEPGTEMMDI